MMARKGRVESAIAISDWILLALFISTRTVASCCPNSSTFPKGSKLRFATCTPYLLLGCLTTSKNCKTFCLKNQCVTVDVDAVLNLYPNMLKPINEESLEISAKENKMNSDLDICCPTSRAFFRNNTLKNINGVERLIFKTENLHQLVPVGSCQSGGKCTDCRIRHRTISILVIKEKDKTFPVEFDQFNVPLYCTCFNTINI